MVRPVNSTVSGKQQAPKRIDLSSFEVLKVLGTGAYGKVFLVRKNGGHDHRKLYAMKVLKKVTVCQKQKTLEHTKTERRVLESIKRAPFLVSLHYAFQTSSKLHLVLDYISGGELFTHLYQKDHFSEHEVRIYIGEIILALEHLHKLGIIYRDIKLENILLDSEGHIVLTDFGLSKEFLPHETDLRTYSFCGTIEYMAPEVVRGSHGGHDFSVDWWSVGVLTYELLTGASPFTVEGEKNTQAEISKRILKSHPPIPDYMSPSVQDFIMRLLVKDARKRLGGSSEDASELKRHAFFRGINWDDMAAKKIPAPFVPKISGELDTSNFAEEFTSMGITDSPSVVPPNVDEFKGYSYISPSILFNEKAISDEMFQDQEASLPPPTNQTNQIATANQNAASSLLVTLRRIPSSHDTKKMATSGSQYCPKPDTAQLLAAKFSKSAFFEHYVLKFNEAALGDGSFSVCRKCVHKKTGVVYAVKIVSRKLETTREIHMLQQCQGHPNVVKLVEVFQDELHTYIVTELLRGGELLERIRTRKNGFTEAEAGTIFHDLVSAVSFMHSQGIVHRDLKPENLLFSDESTESQVKVVDFGFARFKPVDGQPMRTPCYTLNYAAPEVLKHALSLSSSSSSFSPSSPSSSSSNANGCPTSGSGDGYTESCDLWSLGVILFTMLSGKAPFQMYSNRESDASLVVQRIQNGEFSLSGPSWARVSSKAKDLLKGLLTIDPKKRSTLRQVLVHPWFQATLKSVKSTPLCGPELLSLKRAEESLRAMASLETLQVSGKTTRENFRLQDVSSASLAQRRKVNKNSTDIRTDSSDSGSGSSSTSSRLLVKRNPPLKLKFSLNGCSTSTSSSLSGDYSVSSLPCSSVLTTPTTVALSTKPLVDPVFSFSDHKVNVYLSSLPNSVPLLTDIVEECPDSSVTTTKRHHRESSCTIVSEVSSREEMQCPTLRTKRPRLSTIVID
ncbi:Ribosomal protein S6 kinase alpha-5 [Halotydeus destructor]|nr:Ribosomal protein S6 kinase alpha-5 [Halotydeus destructor]